MKVSDLQVKGFFLIILMLGLILVTLQIFAPFVNIIVIALIIVQIFHPVYASFKLFLGSKGVSSVIATLVSIFFLVVPITFISILAANEINTILTNINQSTQEDPLPNEDAVNDLTISIKNITSNAQNSLKNDDFANTVTTSEPAEANDALSTNESIKSIEQAIFPLVDSLNLTLQDFNIDFKLSYPNLTQILREVLTEIQNQILPTIGSVISGGLNVIFFLFLLIISLLFLFTVYDQLPKVFSKYSPLDNKVDNLLFKKFRETTRAVLLGTFVVAIAQATAVSLALSVIGIGAPILLWIIMVILSVVPIGSGIVWFPIGVILMIIGQPAQGIVLIVYSAIIINVIDAFLRPLVMRGGTKLHPLAIILAVMGGIGMFGPLGILYGPLILVLLTTVMEVYNLEHSQQTASQVKKELSSFYELN